MCCSGRLYPKRTNYQCCYGIYKLVKAGQTCCRDADGTVVVGDGNSCCAGQPYTNTTTMRCVCSTLYNDGHPRQCCGGKVMSGVQICCGGTQSNGRAYDVRRNYKCCGADYIASTSLCCQTAPDNWKVRKCLISRVELLCILTCLLTT